MGWYNCAEPRHFTAAPAPSPLKSQSQTKIFKGAKVSLEVKAIYFQ
jgi:hypothetical protein